jgi:uncharacterized Zn finger protein
MSRWDHWGWYQPTPKLPPPKRGIRAKKTGATWWGRRWVDALERMSFGYSNRLARGRTYARAGRTHDLVVKAGEVTAKVTGSRATPYKVGITLAKLPPATWTRAIVAMAAKAQFAAELLAGQMPQEIDRAFEEAGASVFPAKESDLQTSCTCPDWANPCKHVAATHYVLGEALDRDPFLLFELRGRTKEQVLGALRAVRADGGDVASSSGAGNRKVRRVDANEVPSVSLAKLAAADYDKPRAPIPTLHFRFETPPVSGAVLRQLGTPPAWSSDTSPVEMLAPIVRAAAEEARRLALAEPEAIGEAEPGEDGPAWARVRATAKAAKKRKTAKAKKVSAKKAERPDRRRGRTRG